MLKKLLFILFSFWLITSCKKEQPKAQLHTVYQEASISNNIQIIAPKKATTYDKDSTYDYRTGTSRHYKYNHKVSGTDYEGKIVHGHINIEGNYGEGKLTNDKSGRIDIVVERTRNGKLKGTDIDGYEYELVVE
jgi:hypothetical protein